MRTKNLLIVVGLVATLISTCFSTQARTKATHPADDELILHAWSWSFDTIAANMQSIAQAGYDYVQTSPAQACYVGEDGGMSLFSEPGDSIKGKWYYYYQPTDWTIGNYMMGNRDNFKAMCDSAYKYGVKVIVDVVPNHTAVDDSAVLPGLDNAVGGHENLYHANGFTPIQNWNDRLECTTGEMGGLKDVNTENPDFQYYYLQYINDLINLGARGFRYDTAKHIGLPSDPLDSKSVRNNFWDVATGKESVRGLSMLMPDSIYIYGEVLQDKNVKETEYAEYIDQTASSYGHALRTVIQKGNATYNDIADWCHPVNPGRLVTWIESHDTYCNDHESASLTDGQIRVGWVIVASRAGGRPLFYNRPAGSSRNNLWGNNRIGARGNDEYLHPEVVAANNFRKKMSGLSETIYVSDKGDVIEVARGDAGVSLVNITNMDTQVKMPTTLPDGKYHDVVHHKEFTVKSNQIKGSLTPLTSYILYKD